MSFQKGGTYEALFSTIKILPSSSGEKKTFFEEKHDTQYWNASRVGFFKIA